MLEPFTAHAAAQFKRCARELAAETVRGHDWGAYIVVDPVEGVAMRSHRPDHPARLLVWPISTRGTTMSWLMRKWRWEKILYERGRRAL